MFSEEDIRTLAEFPAQDFLLTTVYYQVSRTSNRSHRDGLIQLKGLLREGRRQWNGRALAPEKLESLEQDAQRMEEVLSAPSPNGGGRAQALFACSGRSFFKAIPLPPGSNSGVYVGDTFRLRPLVALLDRYPRHCIVVLDRERAFLSEVLMGEVEDQGSFQDQVPPRVRATAWGGYRERTIERHADQEVHRHYERVAEALSAVFKRRRFGRLVLGGHLEALSEFENQLSEELRRLVVGRFAADLRAASGDEARAHALDLVHESDCAEKQRLVAQALNNAGPQGLGVLGLDATLAALARQEVQTLLVGEGFSAAGQRCVACGYLGVVERSECPQCSAALQPVDDVVEQAINQALREGSRIRFIGDHEGFQRAGDIGAFLRYRSESRPAP